MADFPGRKVSYGIAPETTRGTAVAPTYWLAHLDADFQDRNELGFNESVLGVLSKNNESEVMKDWAEGKIDGKITDKAFPLLLWAALGSLASANASGETTVKDHTITESNSATPKTLTLTRKDPNNDLQHPMGMLKTLEITAEVGEYVQYSSTWISKKGVTASDTVAYVAENEFKAKHATAKLATNIAGLAGATAIPLKRMRITIDRDINPYFTFGSNDPSDILLNEVDVTGEMVLRYTDNTYKTLWQAGTHQAVLLDLKNTDVSIGVAPSNPRFQFQLAKADINEMSADFGRSDTVEQTLSLQAMHSIADGFMAKAIATNTVTSY